MDKPLSRSYAVQVDPRTNKKNTPLKPPRLLIQLFHTLHHVLLTPEYDLFFVTLSCQTTPAGSMWNTGGIILMPLPRGFAQDSEAVLTTRSIQLAGTATESDLKWQLPENETPLHLKSEKHAWSQPDSLEDPFLLRAVCFDFAPRAPKLEYAMPQSPKSS